MKQILLIMLLFSFSMSPAYAAELTLKECIELALEDNGQLKAFKTDLTSSAEEVSISNAALLPSLKLRSAYTLRDTSDVFITRANIFAPGIPPTDIKQSLEDQNFYGASLVLEQPIFRGGQLTHSLNKSKILDGETNYRVERQKKLLVFDVKRAFYAALKEQLYRKTLEKIVESKRERLRVVKGLHEEGYVQEDDVLLAETDSASAELDRFKAKNREDLAISRLKRLIYLKDEGEISLKEKPMNGFLLVSLREARQSAVAQREELKISLGQIGAAGEDIDIAKSDFYPKISLQGSYTEQKETTIFRPEVWMLTAQLDWSIFDWNKTRSSVKKAESMRQKRQYEHEDLIKAVMLEAEEAWREVKDKEKEVEFLEKKLRTTESRFKTATERYAEKTIKLADLLETEAEWTKAYDEYLSAVSDLNISFAHLEAATSVKNDGWLSIKEPYEPDFDFLLKSANAVIAGPSGRVPENAIQIDTPFGTNRIAQAQPIATRIDAVQVAAPKVPPQTGYVIQVRSFRQKQSAEEFVKKFMKNIEPEKITVLTKGNFCKVRIIGFKSKAEAEDFSRKFPIKKSIIVKAIDEH